MPTANVETFFSWFQSHKGYVDRFSVDIFDFPVSEGGTGVIALKDIPEGYTIFSIPRSLVLGTRTSLLPSEFGFDAWKNAKLNEGWSGIILCMMWEAALGPESKWSKYFDILPVKFDTPMFWDEEDLAELKGTAVVDKIGKDRAETDYREKIVPALHSRPDLFKPEDVPTHYSLEMYHIMGTRLLSRSFTLENEEGEIDNFIQQDQETGLISSSSSGIAMDTDGPQVLTVNDIPQQDDRNQDSETIKEVVDSLENEEDDSEELEIVMVPLADMLNARFMANNVKLFCEPDCLKMVSSRPIIAGEQIWNTYGDRPNSDLLCGFGHVDYIPLPAHIYGENLRGNPGDVVDIRADLVVKQALEIRSDSLQESYMHDRIDWWLEEGGDDVFELEIDPSTKSLSSLEISPALVSFTRLILFDSEWDRSKAKGKPPRPKAELMTLRVMKKVLEKRLEDYNTTLDEDEQRMSSISTLSLNKRHALILRVGEKRLLHIHLKRIKELLAEETEKADKAGNGKRKAFDDKGGRQNKRKR